MKLTLFVTLLFLFSLSFIGAQEIALPPQDIGDCFQIVQTHPNATSINITKISIPTLSPNYSVIPMVTTNGYNYYYDFCNTTIPGEYIVTTCGNGDGVITCMDYSIPVGLEISLPQVILFGFVFILIGVFLYASIMGVLQAINASWQIFYVCTTYLLFFSIFFVGWLFSDKYLWATPILASIFWIIWLILSILFWPFVIGVSAYILKKEAEALMVDGYVKQGYSREDSQELAKRKRG